jgi:serine/threonine protein kinase
LIHTPKETHDRPMARTISQAMEQAGIRPSQRHRKVSDYVLEQIIGEGPGHQDWEATHSKLTNVKRRVRIYTVRSGATEEERKTLERAAQREALLLETLQHQGVLRREGFTDHELGPALILEHDPQSVRLDHFIAQNRDKLGVDIRLDLIRQIAEIIRFAHDKKVVHRALSPQSILVIDASSNRPRVKIYNWQMGYRAGTASQGVSREVSPTSHIDRLVDDISTAYMAPESLSESETNGEHLDVFSLGAIAYHLFSGESPAANGLELSIKLRENKGLQLSSVLNGTGEHLQFLIQYSTHPEVSSRIDSVTDFLTCLDDVEDELTTPETEVVEDVSSAQKGDLLPRNFEVVKRLGQGACSIALLVTRDGQEFVLKVANDPKHNSRLKD